MAQSKILRFTINFTFSEKGAITLTAKSQEVAVKRFKSVKPTNVLDSDDYGSLNKLFFDNVNVEEIEEYKPPKKEAAGHQTHR